MWHIATHTHNPLSRASYMALSTQLQRVEAGAHGFLWSVCLCHIHQVNNTLLKVMGDRRWGRPRDLSMPAQPLNSRAELKPKHLDLHSI